MSSPSASNYCNDNLVFGDERKRLFSLDVSHDSNPQEFNAQESEEGCDEGDEEEVLFALAKHQPGIEDQDGDFNGGKKRVADTSRDDSGKRVKVTASHEKEWSPSQLATLMPIHPIPMGNYPYGNRTTSTGSTMMTTQQQQQRPMMMLPQLQQCATPSVFLPSTPFQVYPPTQHRMMVIPETPLHTTIPRPIPPPPLSEQRQQQSYATSVALSCDSDELSAYQCLLRRQLEFFQATPWDIQSKQQGRRKHLTVGQTGLRCRHCAAAAVLPQRVRGAVYFPAALDGIYQAAQNMSKAHFLVPTKCCSVIPPALRDELCTLRQERSNGGCGGKRYWADAARALGIYETEQGLRWKERDGTGE